MPLDKRPSAKVLPFPPADSSLTIGDLTKSLVQILLLVAGFLAAYFFYDFSNTLKQVRQDISSLQVSFSALSQHVQDEDNLKK